MAEDLRQEHVDILMTEFTAMREEVLLHFRNAKLHLRYFQIFIAAVLAVIWYLFINTPAGTNTPPAMSSDIVKLIGTQGDLLFYGVIAMMVLSYYFAVDILDSYFCVFLAGARLAIIEEQINKWAGRNLLVWESKFQGKPVAVLGSSRLAISVYQIFLIWIVGLLTPRYVFTRLASGQLGANWSLTHPDWINTARCASIVLFIVFIVILVDVFFIRVRWARHVIAKLTKAKLENAA